MMNVFPGFDDDVRYDSLISRGVRHIARDLEHAERDDRE